MFEWESNIDDPGNPTPPEPAPGPAAPDMQSFIDAQKLELERRKEQQKIELEINKLLDDRIGSYTNLIKIAKLEVDNLSAVAKEGTNLQNNLAKAKAEQAGLTEGTKKHAKATENVKKAQKDFAKFIIDVEAAKDAFINLEGMPKSLKREVETNFKKMLSGEMSPKEFQESLGKIKGKMDILEDGTKAVGSAFSGLGKKLGITATFGDTALGKMTKGFADLAKAPGSVLEKMALVGKGFASMMSPLNILGNLVGFVVESFFAMEEASIAVTKATGATRAETESVFRTMQGPALRDANIDVKELGKSYGALRVGLKGFKDMNEDVRKSLTRTTAEMAKLGISEKKTANITRMLSYQFGGTKVGAEQAQKQFQIFSARAMDAGLSMQQAASDFEQFAGQIESQGGNATEEVIKLGMAAQETGVSISQMLNIAKKFNTFKTGADAAAKMNAVFGTNISSIDMMGKNTKEINETMRQSLIEATGGYDMMTKHQRLAAAEMLGFGDNVKLVEGYLNANNEVDEEAALRAKNHAEAMAQLQTALADVTPTLADLANKFKAAFMDSELFQKSLKWLQEGGIEGIVAGLMFFADIILAILNNVKSAIIIFVAWKLSMFLLAPAFAAASTAAAAGGGIAGAASAGWAALSAGMIGVLIVLALIIVGFMLYMRAMHKKGSPALWELAGAMAIGVLALGAAFYFAGPAMMAALPALIVIMAGLVAIFYLLPPLVESVGKLVKTVLEGFAAMVSAIAQVYQVFVNFVTVIFDGISSIIESIGSLYESFGTMVESILSGIAMVVEAIGGFVDSFTGMFEAFLGGIQGIIEAFTGFVEVVVGGLISMVQETTGVYALAGALGTLAIAFGALGMAAGISSIGIGASVIAMAAMRTSMMLGGTSFKEMIKVGQAVGQIGKGLNDMGTGMEKMKNSAKSMISALGGNKSFLIHGSSQATTVVAGAGGGVAFVPANIKVDVNMDDAEIANTTNVTVVLDGEQLRYIIAEEIANTR